MEHDLHRIPPPAALFNSIMASIGTGYDLSSTTFSPDGRVFQIEYAAKAVENSGTCLGIRAKDGVVIAVEKTVISKMLVAGTLRRAHIIDKHATIAICGLLPDGRVIVDHARKECANYKEFYGRNMPGSVLADRIAHFIHLYTLHWHVRPFGCAVIMGVHENNKSELYMIEPSGVSYRYYACAFGKGKAAARTELEKLSLCVKGDEGLSMDEAVDALAKVLVGVHDDAKDKEYELEMICVGEKGAKMVPRERVKEVHERAKKEAEDDSDMEE